MNILDRTLVAIYDKKSAIFFPPAVKVTPAEAIRWFTDVVNVPDKDNLFYHHSEDFCLYNLGVFDIQEGLISQDDKLQILVEAKDVLVNFKEESK